MSEIEINPNMDFAAGLVLPIDKPYGWTSADVVRRFVAAFKYIGYKKIKVGHAGTLDPLATGVLIICIGKATKQAESLQAEQKEYICEVELGATTPCFDMEHEVDFRFPYEHITKEMVQETLLSFLGEQEQVPPIYSAKSINGRRAYEYARAGEEVEMRKAIITIYDIELLSFDLPKVKIRLSCSKGTYIRSFARDLGVSLNSGGHLTSLCRTKSGVYSLSECLTVDKVMSSLKPLQETV
ncbi:MAG: tRNA pseudouridine(55) synthase TruB [Rikenellaceae bacterium]